MNKISLVIHGGAGTISRKSITPEKESLYKSSLLDIVTYTWNLLNNGCSAVDAVEHAVSMLEDDPLFNAGKGSVYNENKEHEMDASIMDGKNLNAGAVSIIKKVKNPVRLARKIMEVSEYVYLSGKPAERFAAKHNLEIAGPGYFHTELRYEQYEKARINSITALDHSQLKGNHDEKFGTVGAVALDINGNLAAATSSGGMTNKAAGRIGDSPVIGAGTYADNNTCAVSCTGHGEYFIRGVIAYDISCLMKYKGLSLNKACEYSIYTNLNNIGGKGGVIAVDKEGKIGIVFNTEGMYRGYISAGTEPVIKIYSD